MRTSEQRLVRNINHIAHSHSAPEIPPERPVTFAREFQ